MKSRIREAMPMISVLLFLTVGFIYSEWLYGLLFFLLIPLTEFLLSDNFFLSIRNLFPVIIVIIFLVLALEYNYAHPGWLVFLLIPIFETLFPSPKKRNKDFD